MGCISSKHVIVSPLPYHNHHHSSSLTLHNDNFPHSNHSYALLEEIVVEKEQDHARKQSHVGTLDNDKESKKNGGFKFGLRFGRSSVAEHVAAGWPAWLSAVAGDAIHGWVPLKSDSFERLEKVYHLVVSICTCLFAVKCLALWFQDVDNMFKLNRFS